MSEFGESVLFHPPKTNKEKRQKNALAERALDGVWLYQLLFQCQLKLILS